LSAGFPTHRFCLGHKSIPVILPCNDDGASGLSRKSINRAAGRKINLPFHHWNDRKRFFKVSCIFENIQGSNRKSMLKNELKVTSLVAFLALIGRLLRKYRTV
jgi:hypothetical protein